MSEKVRPEKAESYEDVMKEYDRLALMDMDRWGSDDWLSLAYRVVGKLQKLGKGTSGTESETPGNESQNGTWERVSR